MGPYGIEELNTARMIFGSDQYIITIIKNSPHLKVLHLDQDEHEAIFQQLAISCKKLETIQADFVGRTDEYLYGTFFCDMKREQVQKAIINDEEISKTFPNLRAVNMWNRMPPPKDFLHSLMYVYPQIESYTTLHVHNLTTKILTPPTKFLQSFSNSIDTRPSQLKSVSIETYIDYSMNHHAIEAFVKQYPHVKNITLLDGPKKPLSEPLQEIGKKLSKIVNQFQAKSLVIHSMDLSLYQPTIDLIGHRLHSLNIHANNIDSQILITLLNKCPNLKKLEVCVKSSNIQNMRQEIGLNPMPKLETLHAWTDSVDEDEDFSILLMNLLRAAKNVRSLQLNSHLPRVLVADNKDPPVLMQKVERLALMGSSCCNGNSNVIDSFLGTLPALHTLVLYFKPADVNVYRTVYSGRGLNIVSGEKLLGQETTQYLLDLSYQY